MTERSDISEDLQKIYQNRFQAQEQYRSELWRVLCGYFSQWIGPNATVLDLGCGYCEFINNVEAGRRLAMDLNPDSEKRAHPNVRLLLQDCSRPWPVPPASLDVVFTSNFFEHLPSKATLEETLDQAFSALKPGGRLIALGPNIRYLAGEYWDFFDHYLPLTHLSLSEGLRRVGFEMEVVRDRFLPYTMSHGFRPPIWTVKAFLNFPLAWKVCGRQFLVIAKKPAAYKEKRAEFEDSAPL